MIQQNLASFWPYWNCEESTIQPKALSRPVPINKNAESQDLINFFAVKPPIFRFPNGNGEWRLRIGSRYWESDIMSDRLDTPIFNNQMIEFMQNKMNSSQIKQNFNQNSFAMSPHTCFTNIKELSSSIDDNKTKPSHYENSEDKNKSIKLNSISQQKNLIEIDTNISKSALGEVSNFEENKLSVPDENLKCLSISMKSVPKNAKNESTTSPHLQFSNPSNSFATRCDVVYKTLLRDCRKYFTDALQMKSMRKSKKLDNIGRVLDEFVRNRFEQFNEDSIHQLKFYLG